MTKTNMMNESTAGMPRMLILFGILITAAIVATAAMLPAMLFLLDSDRATVFAEGPVDPVPLVTAFAVGNTILSAIAIGLGLRLESSVHMGVPLIRSWLTTGGTQNRGVSTSFRRCGMYAVTLSAITLVSGFLFRSELPALPAGFVFPPIWQGILMLLGAAVREEILFRFFAMNLLVWLAMQVFRKKEPTTAIVWTVNVSIAIVFTLMHLLPATQMLDLSGSAMGVIMPLVTVAGILFGWTYWRHGLVLAIYAHAICSLVLYLAVRIALYASTG